MDETEIKEVFLTAWESLDPAEIVALRKARLGSRIALGSLTLERVVAIAWPNSDQVASEQLKWLHGLAVQLCDSESIVNHCVMEEGEGGFRYLITYVRT